MIYTYSVSNVQPSLENAQWWEVTLVAAGSTICPAAVGHRLLAAMPSLDSAEPGTGLSVAVEVLDWAGDLGQVTRWRIDDGNEPLWITPEDDDPVSFVARP
ncbi:hypothetical protein ACFEMC_22860 [Kineococcus sp. DHX-1]|uniref:hypothetical protein n=1 Tax=Kineococcus sp. DHX-1 TaxID=3349638 RepID=UPI0036D41A7F